MAPTLSARAAHLEPSPIREILAVVDRPGMISFAGGLPSPATFADFEVSLPDRDCLQYGPTEGEPALRAAIAGTLCERGLACAPEQVLVLAGSQQGIDLASKLFIDPGTPVAVESPTYLAALQVFRFFGARLVEYGAGALGALASTSTPPRLVYALPTFRNPTGDATAPADRDALAAACDRADATLLEDDPYHDLAYEAVDRIPVAARLERASWIYQGSFSKTLAPGLRLGYLAASPDLFPKLARAKQAADLHSSRLAQRLVLDRIVAPAWNERLRDLAAGYRRRRDRFDAALSRHFGELAAWNRPAGGLFFWLELTGAPALDTRTLLPRAIDEGVAFMPGEPFFASRPQACGALRLNFSHADEDDIERGLQKLSAIVRARQTEFRVGERGAQHEGHVVASVGSAGASGGRRASPPEHGRVRESSSRSGSSAA